MVNDSTPYSAFTSKFTGITRTPKSPIHIAEPFDPSDQLSQINWIEYVCIWDTGATGSVISPKVVGDLKLQPTGKTLCNTAGGQALQNTYLVSIKLPNNVSFSGVRVTEAPIQGFDALIGMDIITKGDFAITNMGGITLLSYRYPSMEAIDFVAEYKHKIDDEKRQARNRRKRNTKKGK